VCAEIAPKKIFGWLRIFTNSAEVGMCRKKNWAAAGAGLIFFGAAALGGDAGF